MLFRMTIKVVLRTKDYRSFSNVYREVLIMKCKECKYKNNVANTEETGTAICSYPSSWFPVHLEDNCHFIPEKKELTCGDCARLGEDTACIGCTTSDSAYYKDELCDGFIDKKEDEFNKILMFWKVQGFYNRDKINKMLDEFEQYYEKLVKQ